MQAGKNMLLYRGRWAVIIGSIFLIGAAVFYGRGLFPVLKVGGYEVPGSDSLQAQHILDTYLHGATPDIIILMRADGLHPTDEVFQSAAQSLLTKLSKRKEVSSVTSYYSTQNDRFLSKDGQETFALVQLVGTDETVKEDGYTALEPSLVTSPLQLTIGGEIPFNVQLNHQVSKDLEFAEMLTLPIVAILLVVVFGGIISALLPLIIGAVTSVCAFAVLRVFSNFTPISIFAVNIVTMLGLGLAIDYALLIVTRFREELVHNDRDVPRALRRTMRTAGRAVIFSGLTVSVSLLGLLLFPEMFLRSMGLGAIAATVLALLCALTILPALLALLGHRINLLSVRRPVREATPSSDRQTTRGVWAQIAQTVMRWPVPVLVGVIVMLLTLGYPFLGASFSTPDVRVLPADASARIVSDRLSRDFAQPGSSQAVIAVTTSGDALSAANLAKLDEYVRKIKTLSGVETVDSLVTVDPQISLELYQQGYGKEQSPDPEQSLDPELVSLQQKLAGVAQQLAHGSYTKVVVFMKPANLSTDAVNLVRKIRALSPPQGLTPQIAGSAASQIDLFTNLQAVLPLSLAVIVVSIFVLLFLMTGSILVPLKAVIVNILSLTATFGALVWIFQQGHLQGILNFQSLGNIDGAQPILIFATAFGLSMDYEVFLLSRIKEEYDATGNNQRAVSSGLQRTGGLITSAALLLAVVVGAFSTSHIITVKEVGVGLAIAILMDASVIRVLLVPATMRLLGAWNWWAPRPLQVLWRRFGLSEASGTEEILDLVAAWDTMVDHVETIGERIVVGNNYSKEQNTTLNAHNLYDLASNNAKWLMQLANVEKFAVDDCILLANSPDFKGWAFDEIETTFLLNHPLPFPDDLMRIQQEKTPLIKEHYVNQFHYKLVSASPAFSNFDRLKIVLAPIDFFTYFSVDPFLDEPLLASADGSKISIRQKYGHTTLTYSSADKRTSLIPAPVSVQCIILTADQQIVLMQRSHAVAFYPGHWSASFEETMNAPMGPDAKGPREGDRNFITAAMRGLNEKFAVQADDIKNIKVLSLNIEYLTLSSGIITFIELRITASEMKQRWLLEAKHREEASKFATWPVALPSVVDKLFSSTQWHPTSRMRLIQFLFYKYGINKVAKEVEEKLNAQAALQE